jgi:hypothetical protein
MREAGVQRSIWLALGRVSTLFRLNSGKGWVSGGGKPHRLGDGSVIVPNGRPIALGLALANGDAVDGPPDLLGWTSIEITPEMVGKTVAVVTGIEAKRSEGGRKSKEQKHFHEQLRAAGGIVGFAASVEEALAIVADYIKRLKQ